MAGDLPADESVLLESVTYRSDTPGAALARPAQPGPASATPAPDLVGLAGASRFVPLRARPNLRPLHSYGRVRVVAAAPGDLIPPAATRPGALEPGLVAPPAAPDTVALDAGQLNLTENLGLGAFRLRDSDAFRQIKAARPRDGEPWDHDHPCVFPVPPASSPAAGSGTAPTPAAVTPRAGDGSGGATQNYMEGSIAVGLIMVEGPTADLQFTPAERTKFVAEVQNGLSWWASQNPAAGITFAYDIRIVRLTRPANPGATDLEAYWRDPAMASLGFAANFKGVYDYVGDLKKRLATQWSYAGFVTKYPLSYFAYSAIGGPRLVMSYANDGWGPDNLDRVFAHETGHIFGAVDEYKAAGCTCGGAFGRFGVPNGNCDGCNPSPEVCIMRSNAFALCRYTPSHVGWGTGVVANPAMVVNRFQDLDDIDLVTPASYSGLTHIWRDKAAPNYPWRGPERISPATGPVDAIALIQSHFDYPGSLEAVIRTGSVLRYLWRDSLATKRWRAPTQITTGVSGVPSFIQSRYGTNGNFELLVPSATRGLVSMWRNNDAAGYPWSSPATVLPELGLVPAVSHLHANGGNLEGVVRVGAKLTHIYRAADQRWHQSVTFADGAGGNPVMIQSSFGTVGNFEVVAPRADTGLVHYARNNDVPGFPWSAPAVFGTSLGRVDAVTLVQNTRDDNLEVVARAGDRLYLIWRGGAPSFAWSTPTRIL